MVWRSCCRGATSSGEPEGASLRYRGNNVTNKGRSSRPLRYSSDHKLHNCQQSKPILDTSTIATILINLCTMTGSHIFFRPYTFPTNARSYIGSVTIAQRPLEVLKGGTDGRRRIVDLGSRFARAPAPQSCDEQGCRAACQCCSSNANQLMQ